MFWWSITFLTAAFAHLTFSRKMNPSIHIKAADGTDFYQQLATFAYASYVHHGFGAVVITQGESMALTGTEPALA